MNAPAEMDIQMDDMSHNDHQTSDPHAGHSVPMFRDKFWLSLALTIPVVFWSTDVQQRRTCLPGRSLLSTASIGPQRLSRRPPANHCATSSNILALLPNGQHVRLGELVALWKPAENERK